MLLSGAELVVRSRQETREPLGPGGLPCRFGDQILADLDLDMRQAAALAVDRDGVVGQVGDPVGLVLADEELAFGAQQVGQGVSEPGIAVEQHADMPRARHAPEDRGKAVQCH